MGNRAFCNLGFALPFTIAGFLGLTGNNSVFAQLTQDNTLGAESSTVTVEELRDLIRGGAIRGNALFHSFSEFNVGSDRGVFFDLQNNADILNIFTRVTGGNSSQILGTLGVLNDLGNANLFLLNPNGITFGGNASLQLNGSFFATTADGFGFDNFTFSASGGEAPPPLLTVSIPPFLSFRDNPGDIAVNRDGILNALQGTIRGTNQVNLSVNQGQNLSLVGGNVTFEGGQLNGGKIELAGMFVAGNVTINDDFSFTFPDVVAPENFRRAATNATNTGTVTINADTLTLSNGVQIVSQTENSTELAGITINATDSVNVNSGSRIQTEIDGTGSAEGITINSPNVWVDGNLNRLRSSILVRDNIDSFLTSDFNNLTINAETFKLSNDAQIGILNFGNGRSGNTSINVIESVEITNGSRLRNRVRGEGSIGDISIDANSLLVNDSFITGSKISINTSDSVTIGSESQIEVDPFYNGEISINTDSLFIANSYITGSEILINTLDSVTIGSNSQIETYSFYNGEISIDTDSLLVNDSFITGSKISINTLDSVTIGSNSQIETYSFYNGEISINTDSLFIANSFIIGGDIGIYASNLVDVNFSEIIADGFENGNINISANSLSVINQSVVLGRRININTLLPIRVSPDSLIEATEGLNINSTLALIELKVGDSPEDAILDLDDATTQSVCYDFGGDSQLSNTGRGGIPQIPGLVVRNSVINVDLVDEVLLSEPPPEAIKPHHRTDVVIINSEGEEIKPAMGAVLLPDGTVDFVDYNPAEVYRDMYVAAGCSANK